MPYVDLLGHQTWVHVEGDQSETVVLLHGGLSNSDAMMETIGRPLGRTYRLAAFDRRGHGRTADTDEPFHYAAMADETIAFLEHIGGRAHLVGWSDGGIVALLVALRRPDLVGRLVAIGANYHFDGVRPAELPADSPMIAMISASYAERSPDGAEHFSEVMRKAMTLFDHGTDDDHYGSRRDLGARTRCSSATTTSSTSPTRVRSTNRSPAPSSQWFPGHRNGSGRTARRNGANHRAVPEGGPTAADVDAQPPRPSSDTSE